MAANENHTISLMVGDDPGSGGSSLAVGQMGDAGSDCDFVRAKKKINEIFMEIENYVRGTDTCVQSKYKRETDLNWSGQVGVIVFLYFCCSLLIVH